jgi:hypothetical protein
MSDTQTKTETAQSSSTAESSTASTQTQTSTDVSVSTANDQSKTQPQDQSSVSSENKDGKDSKSEEVFELQSPDEKLIDKTQVDQFKAFAKENGLTQAQAQKILERQHSQFKDAIAKSESDRKSEFEGWVKSIKEDKVLGGENLSANMEIAKRGFDRFATPELRKLLNDSGYGSHPDIVRLFFAIGKAAADDKSGGGSGGGSEEPQTLGALLYGNKK